MVARPVEWDPQVVSGQGQRIIGTVKSFQGQWGFLTAEGVDGDIFVHLNESPDLKTPPRPGELLEFDLASGGAQNSQAKALNARPANAGQPSVGSLTGVISSFRDAWGLIESPFVEGRLYCSLRDNPQLGNVVPLPGDEVSFELGTNPKDGRPKAVNVALVLKDQSECFGQRVQGTVRKFTNGWGFAASNRFKGDILLGKKNLAASGLGAFQLQLGECVEFEVVQGTNGQFEAANIMKVNASGRAMAAPPTSMPMAPMAPMVPMPPPAPASAPMHHAALANGPARDRSRSPYGAAPPPPPPPHGGQQALARLTGVVKMFKDSWGFIVSDQIEGDVYVNLHQSPGLGSPLMPGEAVVFDLVRRDVSDRNNGSQAINVMRASGGAVQYAPPQPPQGAFPQPQQQRRTMQQQAVGGPGMQHTGTLVTFGNGWGWLEAPTVPGQVFFGLRDNPQFTQEPQMGDVLSFQLATGPKGRSCAVNVVKSLQGQRVIGMVVEVRGEWGFATCEQMPGKIMLGKKNLQASGIDGATLQVGEQVEFDLAADTKGYEAVNIRKLAN